jgi:CheY-like chemotaxis protein
VESEPGKGSEFRFTIAFRPVSGNNFVSETENNNKKDLFDWKDKNILVVEDNISNFEFIKAVLSKTKVNILWTDNGKSALEIFKKHDDIHLVLMDIQIPEMDGYETTREIKKIRSDVPVIAQTAFAMSRDKEKSIQAGCNDYISKPIKPLDLLNLMEKYISVI